MSAGKDRALNDSAVLVVGGGIAGMAAGMLLAEGGRQVYLLDSAPAIGGSMHLLDHTFPTNSCGICLMLPHQPSLCPTLECERKANLTLLPYAELTGLSGEPGAFTAAVHHKPRYVDPDQVQRLRRVRAGVPRGAAARPRGLAGPGQGDLPPGGPAGRARHVGHRHGLLHPLRPVRHRLPDGRHRPGDAAPRRDAARRRGAAHPRL